jgi:hypothetical protein
MTQSQSSQETESIATHVLITGSRAWSDYAAIEMALEKMPKDIILVHKGAKGADLMADYIWKKMGGRTICCSISPEECKKNGSMINVKMLERMLQYYPIKWAMAFCKNASKGTMHMISLLNAAQIPVMVNLVYD